jgi:hypothetical protein
MELARRNGGYSCISGSDLEYIQLCSNDLLTGYIHPNQTKPTSKADCFKDGELAISGYSFTRSQIGSVLKGYLARLIPAMKGIAPSVLSDFELIAKCTAEQKAQPERMKAEKTSKMREMAAENRERRKHERAETDLKEKPYWDSMRTQLKAAGFGDERIEAAIKAGKSEFVSSNEVEPPVSATKIDSSTAAPIPEEDVGNRLGKGPVAVLIKVKKNGREALQLAVIEPAEVEVVYKSVNINVAKMYSRATTMLAVANGFERYTGRSSSLSSSAAEYSSQVIVGIYPLTHPSDAIKGQ